MKKLVEMIGERNGYKGYEIHNQYENISKNIDLLVEAEVKLSTDEIIIASINWALKLKLKMEYKNIFEYIMNTRII